MNPWLFVVLYFLALVLAVKFLIWLADKWGA